MSEYFYGDGRIAALRRKPLVPRLPERRGVSRIGSIVKLLVGQGHGFIRMPDDREIYFHRSDVGDRTVFNDFVVGDAVVFELLEDAVSGARALRVRRRPCR